MRQKKLCWKNYPLNLGHGDILHAHKLLAHSFSSFLLPIECVNSELLEELMSSEGRTAFLPTPRFGVEATSDSREG